MRASKSYTYKIIEKNTKLLVKLSSTVKHNNTALCEKYIKCILTAQDEFSLKFKSVNTIARDKFHTSS